MNWTKKKPKKWDWYWGRGDERRIVQPIFCCPGGTCLEDERDWVEEYSDAPIPRPGEADSEEKKPANWGYSEDRILLQDAGWNCELCGCANIWPISICQSCGSPTKNQPPVAPVFRPGWLCPRCLRVNAPSVTECQCGQTPRNTEPEVKP